MATERQTDPNRSEAVMLLELTDEDLGPIRLLMGVLANASGIDGLESIELHAVVNGQAVVIGYGEEGDPALLVAEPVSEPRCECGWMGKGYNHQHDARMGKAAE